MPDAIERTREYIPAVIRTALDSPPLWGRVLSVSHEGMELISRFEYRKGRVMALTFELGGELFEDVRGKVAAAVKDSCGYYTYRVKLLDPGQRKALQDKLIRMLSRT